MPEYIKAHGIIYANELKSIHKSRNPMQPIFEAFTNAWEAIFERFTAEHLQNGKIVITFHYTSGMFNEEEHKSCTLDKIEIYDNGLGINEKSFERIVNLRDNSKSALNKGTGRVQFLHFFNETIFESIYEKTNGEHERIVLVLSKKDAFLRENAILRKDSAELTSSSEYGTLVTFINPIDEKNDGEFFNKITPFDVKNELIIHFLSRFCESKEHLPQIIIERYENGKKLEPIFIKKEDIPNPDKTESLDVHYSKLENRKVVDSLNCEHFTLLSFVQSQEQLKKNCIYFVSNGAIAQEVSIDSLQADDSIDGNRYMFLLRGNYFDSIEDDLRGNLHLIKESEFKKQGELFPEECILVDKIKEETNEKINSVYPEFQARKNDALKNLDELKQMFLIDENRIVSLRKKIKTSDSDEQILAAIYRADMELVAKRDARIKAQYEQLKSLSPANQDYQVKLTEQVNSFVKLVPQQNRTNLTKYIARRKLVIEIFDMILSKELECVNKKGRVDEALLHNLIFQQHSVDTESSDIWLLDDQYLLFNGCSEKQLDKIEVNGVKLLKEELTDEERAFKVRHNMDGGEIDTGIRRPDILLYPEEGKCIIIEFKAPDVEVSMYLSQINKYAMMINNLSDDSLQIHAFYGYLIGENINYDYIQEAESAFKEAAYLKYLFRPNYDVPGRFGRPTGNLYTEIIKYSDILKRAKLRNKIFLEKLEKIV
jgi:hypothetical protein